MAVGDITQVYPAQAGQAGKALVTDGAVATWQGVTGSEVILADLNNGKSYRLISVDGALATEEI